jgi:pSer/pThr/pTyr-binding forkhead associated (FHA) protein
MKVRLIERGTRGEPAREVPINESEFLIGRGADCDLRLPVADISRHHCMIRIVVGEATLVDLGSSNGTFLNNQPVRSQTALHSGDVLQVGDCQFVVDLGDLGWTGSGPDPGATTVRKLPRTGQGPGIRGQESGDKRSVPDSGSATPGS